MAEKDRIALIIERDGAEAALKFAEQGMALYVAESVARGPYVESIDFYKKFLVEHGRTVRLVVVDKTEAGR